MTKPTAFGMNGSSLMVGGESGAEAILPLSAFYKQLEAMIDSKLDMSGMEKYLAIIADNSSKGSIWRMEHWWDIFFQQSIMVLENSRK